MIANIVCCLASIVILVRDKEAFALSVKDFTLDMEALKYALRIGAPAGLQGMLFSISNLIIQSGINSFGDNCIAGNTIGNNFEFAAFFMASAFGQTATTFISQNYGAHEYGRCKKVFWAAAYSG